MNDDFEGDDEAQPEIENHRRQIQFRNNYPKGLNELSFE